MPEFQNDLFSEKANWANFKTICFRPGLYIEENENVRISKTKKICFRHRNQNTSFSPIYREEKNQNDLISLLSRPQLFGRLLFYSRTFDKKFRLPHYNHTYIIPRRRRIVNTKPTKNKKTSAYHLIHRSLAALYIRESPFPL